MSKKRSGTQVRPAPARPRPGPRPVRGGGTNWVLPVGVGVAVLVAFVVILVLFARSGSPSTPATGGSAKGQTIDGIQCQTSEQVAYHIHAHLAVYVNGQARTVPMGIGIPDPQTQDTTSGPFVASGSCFYWLHTHQTDGIIHIESPSQRTYTLGNFFDVWGEKLSASQVGSDTGTVVAYVNGQRFTGDPRDVPLTAHAVIQLNVGTDVAPKPYTFASGL